MGLGQKKNGALEIGDYPVGFGGNLRVLISERGRQMVKVVQHERLNQPWLTSTMEEGKEVFPRSWTARKSILPWSL